VLIAGGYRVSPTPTNSAEIFDTNSGAWILTTPMNVARQYHTATLLPTGKVLVTGGTTNDTGGYTTSAELYDPVSHTWANTGSMNKGRYNHSATLLTSGKVLITGGQNIGFKPIPSFELYDIATGTWMMPTNTMNVARYLQTATLLPSGKVLVAGGQNTNVIRLASAELYDPATGLWTLTGSMTVARWLHASVLLPSGKVLTAGGYTNFTTDFSLSSAEIYDPALGMWTATTNLTVGRRFFTMSLLADGRVAAVGGLGPFHSPLTSVELYDVGLGYSNSWRPQITSVTSPLVLNSNLVVAGTQFRGISGGSSGNTQDSPADYPLVQLRSLESGQSRFLSCSNWSTNSFMSIPVTDFTPGFAFVTVFVNGIPSKSAVVNVAVPMPSPVVLSNLVVQTNGVFEFAFTNAPGTLFGVFCSTNVDYPFTNAIGGVAETAPGQFRFSDTLSTNAQKFYIVRAP
jgi:hypothetical protein